MAPPAQQHYAPLQDRRKQSFRDRLPALAYTPRRRGHPPSPSSHTIDRYCSPTATAPCPRGAALPASQRGRRPSSSRLDTPAANCNRLAAHTPSAAIFRRLPLPKPRGAQTAPAVDTSIGNPETRPDAKQQGPSPNLVRNPVFAKLGSLRSGPLRLKPVAVSPEWSERSSSLVLPIGSPSHPSTWREVTALRVAACGAYCCCASRRHLEGGTPYRLLNARLKAASES
jgi:hypothetical protein